MEKLTQNMSGRTEIQQGDLRIFCPPTPTNPTTTGEFSSDCWDLRRSHMQHCWYYFLLASLETSNLEFHLGQSFFKDIITFSAKWKQMVLI